MGESRRRIAEALFSRTQQKVLGLLFSQPERRFYLSEIVRQANKGTGAVVRELARLAGAGLVAVTETGSQKHYQANRASPVFPELEGLIVKLAGAVPAPVLRQPAATYAVARPAPALAIPRARLAALCRRYHVRRLGLFGSAARGELGPQSDIDLLIEFIPGKAPSLWAEPEMRDAFGALFGGRRVDLVPPQAVENPFRRKAILRDLCILYEA
jgi:predicted nucleotidyltransferase